MTKEEKIRDNYLKRTYGGLTLETYKAMLAAQKNGCWICGTPAKSISLAVDHSHKCCKRRPTCGKCTRGLLCWRCNKYVVGVLERMKINAQRVADYLRTFSV